MKVMRADRESQGITIKTMDVDRISEGRLDELRESRIQFVSIRGRNHKRGRQTTEIQSSHVGCQKMSKIKTQIGEVGIVMEDARVWTNIEELASRIRDEERRKTWRNQGGIK